MKKEKNKRIIWAVIYKNWTTVIIATEKNQITKDFNTFKEATWWIEDIFQTEEYQVINLNHI